MNTTNTPEAFAAAKPFPHYVQLQAFRNPADLALAAAEFPPPDDPRWHTFHGEHEEGKQEGRVEITGPMVVQLHASLAAPEFVNWVRYLTGVPDLVADPERVGGGVHQCAPGGHLDLHVDFNVHPTNPALVRRVNLILYLSDLTIRGGALQLVGEDHTVEVPPSAGTMVIFAASDRSWHGHPNPVRQGVRRSIPAYYYAPGTEPARSTTWRDDSGHEPIRTGCPVE